jgi:hypothetical protein
MTKSGLKEELLKVECGLWKNDAELYHRSLTEHALLVFPESGVIGRDQAVAAIREEEAEDRRWADVAFSDVRATSITSEVAALTYFVDARWNYEERGNRSIGTSLYVREDGAWKLALHQQGAVPVAGATQ